MEQLRIDFKEVMLWARKWRLKLSIVKTEFCVFSLDNQVLDEARQYILNIDGQVVIRNITRNPNC